MLLNPKIIVTKFGSAIVAAGPFSRRSDGHMGVRPPDLLFMQGPFEHDKNEILALQYIEGPCISTERSWPWRIRAREP